MLNSESSERRTFERFRVNSSAYAAIGPDFQRHGHIINISRGGVSFSYIQEPGMPGMNGTSSIVLSDSSETLEPLPFFSVDDTGGDMADPHSSVVLRYHRGRFGQLNRLQIEGLIRFLEKKTDFELIAS